MGGWDRPLPDIASVGGDEVPAALNQCFEDNGGKIRWTSIGTGPPTVLVHGTPYSSFIWRAVAPALSAHRQVFLFDHLGYGQSEQRDGQDLTIAAQGRRFAHLLDHWHVDAPSVVATDIGGAIALRALLLESASFGDLLLFDAVTGGDWERGLFALMLAHPEVFEALPGYAHRALVASHMHNATHLGFRPGVLDELLAPWLGADGQAAYYRQYRQLRQADTAEYEHLLANISIPVRILWGRHDQILPAQYAEWIASRLPAAPLSWEDNAGHLIAEDAPARLLAEILGPRQA
jgi:pimeloyl-ACP methyl ester carboxylesterase